MKPKLYGKTIAELQKICEDYGTKKYVAGQIAQWLYKKGAEDIAAMSNISLGLREKLLQDYEIGLKPYIQVLISEDGTKKYCFEYEQNTYVEAVCIFDKQRVTLCISTQAGCKMNCSFCATGKQGFKRNLTCNEILNIYRKVDEHDKIRNIVYMGMGEPLDNYEELTKSLEVLCSDYGYGFSPRRITVSTAGYIPNLKKFLDNTSVDLAVSLHNAVREERQEIMPIEKAYPIEDVLLLLRQYDWSGQRHLTFEYIVFEGLNNEKRHVKALSKLLNGLPCRVNLIPFNTVPDSPYKGADREQMVRFRDSLALKGVLTTIRASKGRDILAACGLLSTKELQEKTRKETSKRE